MFDVWGIEEVHEGMKAVRVEFQARREFLKEVKMNTVEDLLTRSHEMWHTAHRNGSSSRIARNITIR
jgi:hypothetical protein